MEINRIILVVLTIAIIILSGCSLFENKELLTGAAIVTTDNKQNSLDIIIKTNEKYKNMQDFKAVKVIKTQQGMNKEEIIIKKNKYKIKREWIEEGRSLIWNTEIEVNDGKNVGLYKKIESGKFEDAEERFRKAIELDPEGKVYGKVYVKLGWIYNRQGKFEEAEEMFRKAIELDPEGGIYAGLGGIYNRQGKFEEAEEMFRKAIELYSEGGIYSGLGVIYNSQGKFEEAEEMFRKAIELNPVSSDAHIRLGLIYKYQDKFEEAEEMFRKAIELDPDGPVYGELGFIYNRQGKFEEAEEMFRKATIDEEYEEESTFEVIQDTRYDELQYMGEILDINAFRFSLEQNKEQYILEGKKSRSTALWSKIKAEINKKDYSITKLEFYNEIDDVEILTKTMVYENISFNNNFSDEDFILTERAGVE